MKRLPADFLPLAPARRLTVTSADGARLAVQVHGQDGSPTVVLVHGWTLSATAWARVVRRLAPQLRVVVVDQRGHGRSGPVPDGGFTPALLADDLAAVLAATVPSGTRAIVAGHSMGAMALVAFAGRHHDLLLERVAGGLLASTGIEELFDRRAVILRVGGRRRTRATLDAVRASRRVGRAAVTRAALGDPRLLHRAPLPLIRAAIVQLTMPGTATAVERGFCTDLVLACPPRTYQGFAEMLGTLDLTADLPRLDVPVTVLVGTDDRLTPPWHARRIAAALPRPVDLIEVPAAGHMTPLTAPDEVAAAVRGLVDTCLDARGQAVGSGSATPP
ncbi:MAG TPA: alpha/beta hydrolase [Kineosporiaceae bacterium]